MEGHAKKYVERYCELANKTNQQLYKVSTPCSDDHQFKEEELKSVGELSKVSSQIVLKCFTWHVLEDLIFYGHWTNLHDRSQNGPRLVTNDSFVWSLTFIIHVITHNIVMWETLQNSADWDCFKTPILQEILRIQNLHQVEHFAVMSKRTQKKSGAERVTAKSKSMMNLVSWCSERTPDVLPSTAQKNPGKTRHESQFPLSFMDWAASKKRSDPLWTFTHQAAQNGMLIKLGLLKSGNLMNWWMIERRDPLFALKEERTRLKHVSLVNTSTSLWKKKKITIEHRIRLVVRNQIILG